MTVQAHAAVRPEGPAHDYCSDDAIESGQRIQKVGELKHFCCLSVDSVHFCAFEVCDLGHMKIFAAPMSDSQRDLKTR